MGGHWLSSWGTLFHNCGADTEKGPEQVPWPVDLVYDSVRSHLWVWYSSSCVVNACIFQENVWCDQKACFFTAHFVNFPYTSWIACGLCAYKIVSCVTQPGMLTVNLFREEYFLWTHLCWLGEWTDPEFYLLLAGFQSWCNVCARTYKIKTRLNRQINVLIF